MALYVRRLHWRQQCLRSDASEAVTSEAAASCIDASVTATSGGLLDSAW
ncbi:hypothetical protein [Paenibacillus sp. AN1007]|uniref:Uncharacterized protein n=1 Tax=Paenibacillus sp. AN1007 TaxID=3151385 RepID=A0AAU8N663_9BACL